VSPLFWEFTSKNFHSSRVAVAPMRRAVVKPPVFMWDQRDTSIEAVGVGPS
jgi:hypothetical protein